MDADADLSPPLMLVESGYTKHNVYVIEEDVSQNLVNVKKMSHGKPPRHLPIVHDCISSGIHVEDADSEFDLRIVSVDSPSYDKSTVLPLLRSGSCAEKGPKQHMEDEHICIDDLSDYLGETADIPSFGAFYGVFDGHGGNDAALFVKKNILKFIVGDSQFPVCLEKAIRNAFVKADHAFSDDSSLNISSGTTALTTFIIGRRMIIANAGDCRAVLGKRGRAVELSKDHKPNSMSERLRIENLGGIIYDGYLNGQLSVSRAVGDWHMKGPKGSAQPLSAEPELHETLLTEEDEFFIK